MWHLIFSQEFARIRKIEAWKNRAMVITYTHHQTPHFTKISLLGNIAWETASDWPVSGLSHVTHEFKYRCSEWTFSHCKKRGVEEVPLAERSKIFFREFDTESTCKMNATRRLLFPVLLVAILCIAQTEGKVPV